MGVVNHVVKVRRRTVSVCDARIVANNVDVDTVTLDLDSEWSGLSTVVAFGDGDDQVMVSVGVEPVEIPRSLTTASGYLPVTVIGYGGDGLPRMVTAAAPHAMIIVNSGVVPDQSYPDAPDLIGQLVAVGDKANEAADNANAAAGNANAAVDRANELAGKLGDIDAQLTDARGFADAAASSAEQASASASAAQTSEHNASNSATQASQSATAAKQSETNAAESERNAASSERNAASSAEQAANVVASVSGSVTQAENAARSASQSATAAAGSASAAGGSAQAAADSASKAGESATAAKTSETNAASSASAAKISETNAATSATAAQQAVDGFGLEVGTTTTGEPGTDAAVEIQKQGPKYTANFTIPRGDAGPAGVNENVPLGTASGIVAQASDAYPALPRKVQVKGRTIENLWPEMNVSKNGITVSVESGVISVTGTASAQFSTQSVIGSLSPGDKITIAVNKTDANVSFALYAYKSGSFVSNIVAVKGTASKSGEIPADGFDEIRAYIIVEQGVTVDWSGMVMLVEGDTAPDVFVPSGVHTVELTKIIVAGKNLIPIENISSSSSNGINWKANDDKTFGLSLFGVGEWVGGVVVLVG